MSSIANQILCLQKLQDKTSQLDEILQFLKLEQLIDDNQIKSVKLGADHAKETQLLLRDLQIRGKLQLLVYEWQILPYETIMITLVTERNAKDFTYNR